MTRERGRARRLRDAALGTSASRHWTYHASVLTISPRSRVLFSMSFARFAASRIGGASPSRGVAPADARRSMARMRRLRSQKAAELTKDGSPAISSSAAGAPSSHRAAIVRGNPVSGTFLRASARPRRVARRPGRSGVGGEAGAPVSRASKASRSRRGRDAQLEREGCPHPRVAEEARPGRTRARRGSDRRTPPCGRGRAGLQRRARLGGGRAGELAPPQGGVRLCLEKDSSW